MLVSSARSIAMSDCEDGFSSSSSGAPERELGYHRNHWKQRFTNAAHGNRHGVWSSRTKSLEVRMYSDPIARIVPPIRKFRAGPILNNGKPLGKENRRRAAKDGEALLFEKPAVVYLTVTRKLHGRKQEISATVEWATHGDSSSLSTHSSSYV